MNMKQWLEDVKSSSVKKPMPILSFPSTQLMERAARAGHAARPPGRASGPARATKAKLWTLFWNWTT